MGLLLRASGPLRLATLMLTLMLLMMLRLMLLPPLARLTPMMLPLAKLTLKSLRLETLMLQVMETFVVLEKREETVPWPLRVPPPRSALR
jgi:hypothetical protein